MAQYLATGDKFADFTIERPLEGCFVVNKYKVKDPQGQDCILRIFDKWETLNPKTQPFTGGYDVRVSADHWTRELYDDHQDQGEKGVSVHEEEGRYFEYFQNRLSITEDLSGSLGFPQIVEAGAYDGHLYFANEWVEGQDLNKMISRSALRPDAKLKLLHQLVSRCERMHGFNLLHNDIKPSNYLVDRDGLATLSDFDLSLRGERKVIQGRPVLQHYVARNVGTRKYKSPETTSMEFDLGFTEYSDMWSLGVTGYELLVGIVPFDEKDNSKLFRMIREENPIPIKRLWSPVFSKRGEVSDLVHWCLEKDWKNRPRAIDFRRELERILTEVGIDWNRKSNIKVV
jgi:serine/threonine protein kinase